jgi:capsid protein
MLPSPQAWVRATLCDLPSREAALACRKARKPFRGSSPKRSASRSFSLDTSSNTPVVTIPRLSGGAGVAMQASQNTAVQETDPTTASNSSPVSTVAGQVDLSRQLFEFSQLGFDAAITDDLSRAHATAFDVEVINGTATSGRTRGLLSWSGILSMGGTVTNASTFLAGLWQAYSALAYGSGYGAASSDGYVTIVHPRRAAWLAAGVSGTLPPGAPLVPSELVVSAGVPSNLGAGTNEDVALVVEKSQVLLLSRNPKIRVREDVLSSTLTVRVAAERHLAVLLKNATAIAKVTGLTPPAAF